MLINGLKELGELKVYSCRCVMWIWIMGFDFRLY